MYMCNRTCRYRILRFTKRGTNLTSNNSFRRWSEPQYYIGPGLFRLCQIVNRLVRLGIVKTSLNLRISLVVYLFPVCPLSSNKLILGKLTRGMTTQKNLKKCQRRKYRLCTRRQIKTSRSKVFLLLRFTTKPNESKQTKKA